MKGRRFAEDFDRIDTVKPDDRILVQDSGDGLVKFANPSQLPKVEGGGDAEDTKNRTIEYLPTDSIAVGKNVLTFYIPWLDANRIDEYRIYFYRHIRACRRHRSDDGGDSNRSTVWGWVHPSDSGKVVEASCIDRVDNAMRNDHLRHPTTQMSEFTLTPAASLGGYHILHGKNMADPLRPVEAIDIVSPYIWYDSKTDLVRVSFGKTYRNTRGTTGFGFQDSTGQLNGTQAILRNMGFAVVRAADGQRITPILPFRVKYLIRKTDAVGWVGIAKA